MSRHKTHMAHVLKASHVSCRTWKAVESGGKPPGDGGKTLGKLSLPIATACPKHELHELWPTPETKKSFWPTVCCSSCARTDVYARIVRSRHLGLRFSFGLASIRFRPGVGLQQKKKRKIKERKNQERKEQKPVWWGVASQIQGVEILCHCDWQPMCVRV